MENDKLHTICKTIKINNFIKSGDNVIYINEEKILYTLENTYGGANNINELLKILKLIKQPSGVPKLSNDNSKLKELENKIELLRDKLNEICNTVNDDEINDNVLSISISLDKLIVEYIKYNNNMGGNSGE